MRGAPAVLIATCAFSACVTSSGTGPQGAGDKDGACLDVPVPLDPLLFGAGLKERDAISRAAEDGIVVVRYVADGCNVKLRVLTDCHGAGQYEYKAQKARLSKVVTNERAFLETLPVAGKAAFDAFQKFGAIRFDEEIVGRLEGGDAAKELAGNRCDGATHVAVAIDLGGSALSSGASKTLDDKPTLFDERTRDTTGVKIVEQMGDARSCVKANRRQERTPGCDIPLRLQLQPVAHARAVARAERRQEAKHDPKSEAKSDAKSEAKSEAKPEKKPEKKTDARPDKKPVPKADESVERNGSVSIPAGEFWMGSEGNDKSQAPRHKVYLDGYEIDRSEVTAEAYAECVHEGACTPSKTGGQCTIGDRGKADHPINCVTFVQAKAYCAFRKKRLPTEAEWERAARGTDERPFVWGEEWPPPQAAGNFADEAARKAHPYWLALRGYDDGFPETAPVGSFPQGRSPTGALDMAGNVYQWTGDWWSDHYYQKSPAKNPAGPPSGEARVVRGSTFGQHLKPNLHVTTRAAYREDTASEHIGIRCAQSLK